MKCCLQYNLCSTFRTFGAQQSRSKCFAIPYSDSYPPSRFRVVEDIAVQLYEITLNNFAPTTAGPEAWITRNTSISLHSSSLTTVIPGHVQRLRGGDQVRIVVGVVNVDGVEPGTPISDVEVLIDGQKVGKCWDTIAGIPDYYVGDDSLKTHESAEWFDNAKFGLFVHWGMSLFLGLLVH